MAAIDWYTYPNPSPRDDNKGLSYMDHYSDSSTDGLTEDELDNSKDRSIHIGTNHFTAGTQQCQACGTPGTRHKP